MKRDEEISRPLVGQEEVRKAEGHTILPESVIPVRTIVGSPKTVEIPINVRPGVASLPSATTGLATVETHRFEGSFKDLPKVKDSGTSVGPLENPRTGRLEEVDSVRPLSTNRPRD